MPPYILFIVSMSMVTHRGTSETAESYKGIPVHAAPGVHAKVVQLLLETCARGRIADLGAGQGALAQRLSDEGFAVEAFDADASAWLSQDVRCQNVDLENGFAQVAASGPFDGYCVIDVIEHLENPRQFLANLVNLARQDGGTILISFPNPLDTFSAISLFTRGVFNWYTPDHYLGGGHISLLPHWLIEAHLRFLGIEGATWHFLYPYVHPVRAKQMAYRAVAGLRRLMSRSGDHSYFDGQTALVAFNVPARDDK